MSKPTAYIPALGFKWLTPLYDPLLKWIMREETFKRQLIRQANIQPNMHVLDLGCGTGTLTLMLKRAHPDAEVTGLDGDQQILEIARQKPRGVDIHWDEGLASSLPYPDFVFERVVTSLVIHHLNTEHKRLAFKEIHRVLKPQGKILRGGMGTGMPMWGSIFTEEQIWDLTAYLYSFHFEYAGEIR